jgi:hypothetical protein
MPGIFEEEVLMFMAAIKSSPVLVAIVGMALLD